MLGLPNMVMVIAVIGALALAGLGGWKTRDAFCDAAEAKAQLATKQAEVNKLKTELEGYKAAADAGQQAVDVIADLKRNQDDGFKNLQELLAKAPPSTVCRTNADTVRRLRNVPR